MEKSLNYTPKHSGQAYLLMLAILLLVQLAFSIIVSTNKDLASNLIFLSVYRLCLAGAVVALFFLFNKHQNVSNFACGIKNPTSPWAAVIAIVAVVGLILLSSPFISWISYWLSLTGLKVDGSIGFSLDGFFNVLLSVLMLALLPAITEELVFRGIVLNGLRSLGRWPSVLISAAAFSLMHANIPQFPYTFLLGILLGLVMYETKSLWLTMSMHFANNLVVLLSIAIFGTTDIETEAFSTPIWLALIMFACAVLVVFVTWFLVKKIHLKKHEQQVIEKQPTKALDWAWLGGGFLLAIVMTIVYAV